MKFRFMKSIGLIVTIFLIQGCAKNVIYPKESITDTYPKQQFSTNYPRGQFGINNCFNLESCSLNIMLRVRDNAKWICDKKSSNKEVSILAKFTRGGLIIDTVVSNSSEDDEFDKAALEAVILSAPFTELSNLNDKDFKEAAEITFKFTGNNRIADDF